MYLPYEFDWDPRKTEKRRYLSSGSLTAGRDDSEQRDRRGHLQNAQTLPFDLPTLQILKLGKMQKGSRTIVTLQNVQLESITKIGMNFASRISDPFPASA